MKILFTALAAQLKDHKKPLRARLEQALPYARIKIEARRGQLLVDLPPDADPILAVEEVKRAAAAFGVELTRVPGGTVAEPQMWTSSSWREKREPRRMRLSAVIALVVSVSLFCSALTFGIAAIVFSDPSDLLGSTLGTGEQNGEDYKQKIALIDYLFEHYSLYDTNGEFLLDEMLRAYAAATKDEYAAYYTAAELEAMKTEMGGNAVGIGVTVTLDPESGNLYILQVFPGSPAEKAGVLPGDIVTVIGTKAEGELVLDLGYDETMRRMVGEEGTVAQFVVLRDGKEIEFAVTRAKFTSVSAEGRVSETDATVGIIRITGFDAATPTQFKAAMNDLIQKGCRRFVYDVRNNPGGEQRSVVAVLSYFAEENADIMSVVTKDGQKTVTKAVPVTYDGEYATCSVKKEEIGMYRDYPIAVLTNGYTASAGELFTAALSEYKIATLVGENTYGKGVIQSIFDLSTVGSYFGIKVSGGFKLTIGYYAPPSGVNYDKKGIAPDVPVELAPELKDKNLYLLKESEDNQLMQAIQTVLSK